MDRTKAITDDDPAEQQSLLATRCVNLTVECPTRQGRSMTCLSRAEEVSISSGPELDAHDFAAKLFAQGWRVITVTGYPQPLCPACAAKE